MKHQTKMAVILSACFGITSLSSLAHAETPLGLTAGKDLAIPSDLRDDDDGCKLSDFASTAAGVAVDGLAHAGVYIYRNGVVNVATEQAAAQYVGKVVERMQTNPAFLAELDQWAGADGKLTEYITSLRTSSARDMKQIVSVGNRLLDLDDHVQILRSHQALDLTAVLGPDFAAIHAERYPIVNTYEGLGLLLRDNLQAQGAWKQAHPIREIQNQIQAQEDAIARAAELGETAKVRPLTLTETAERAQLSDAQAKLRTLDARVKDYREAMASLTAEEEGLTESMNLLASRHPQVIEDFLAAMGESEAGREYIQALATSFLQKQVNIVTQVSHASQVATANVADALVPGAVLSAEELANPKFFIARESLAQRIPSLLKDGQGFESLLKCGGHAALGVALGLDLTKLLNNKINRANQDQQAGSLDETDSVFNGTRKVDSPSTQPK